MPEDYAPVWPIRESIARDFRVSRDGSRVGKLSSSFSRSVFLSLTRSERHFTVAVTRQVARRRTNKTDINVDRSCNLFVIEHAIASDPFDIEYDTSAM